MGKSLSEIIKEIMEGKTYWLKLESPFNGHRYYFYVNKLELVDGIYGNMKFLKLSVGSGSKSFNIVLPYYQYLYMYRIVNDINENTEIITSKDKDGVPIRYCRSYSCISSNGYFEKDDCSFEFTNGIKQIPDDNAFHMIKMFGVDYLDKVIPLCIHKANADKCNLEGLKRIMASHVCQKRENVSFRTISRIIEMFSKNKSEGKKVSTGWAFKASMRIGLDEPERRRAFEVLGNIDSTNAQISKAVFGLIKKMNIDLDTCDNGGFIAEAICGLADHDNKNWPYFREISLDETDNDILNIFISGSSTRVKHAGIASMQNLLNTVYKSGTFYITQVEGNDFGYAGGTYGMRKIEADDVVHTRPILFGAKNVRKDKLVNSNVWKIDR